MKTELIRLSLENGLDEYSMLQEIGRDEYGFSNEANGMSYDEFKGWLQQQEDYAKGLNLPEGWIPQTTYFLYVDDKPVGIGRIRHYSNELLEQRGVGNLGYGITKPYRGKGYGDKLFGLLLKQCKALGYSSIKLFPYKDNVATNKVMLRHGARLIGTLNGEKNIYEIPIV